VLLAGCAATRVVPVGAPGVAVDATGTSASTAGPEGVVLAAWSPAWQGSPWDLPEHVTPFLLRVTNGGAQPVEFGHPDLRILDDARFQYTALPPEEVARILRGAFRDAGPGPGAGPPVLLASAGAALPGSPAPAAPGRAPGPAAPPGASGPAALPEPAAAPVEVASRPVLHRRAYHHGWGPWGPWGRWSPYWDPWWDPWWGWPYWPPPPVPVADVFARALQVGVVQPGAQVEGFAYFPRLRPGVRTLTLEFHHRVGGQPRVLAIPFAVRAPAP
jgi:hypothetical protein